MLFGLGLGIGSTAVLGRAGGSTPAVPTIISASIRTRVPQQANNNTAFGVVVSTNPYVYTRAYDKALKSITGARLGYFNGVVSTSTILPASINNGFQEQGTGSFKTVRGLITKNLSGTGINQSGGTTVTATFADLVNDVTITSGAYTIGMAWKLDNSTSPPTFTRKTYAQFQADGGSVTSSTVNSASLGNSQVLIPDGYLIISDQMTSLTAGSAYFWGLEERTPVVAVTSITDGTGQFTVNTSNTDNVVAGNIGTVASATGNTTVNGTWKVASVVPNTSITFTAATATTGVVTGTPTLRFTRPTGVVNSNVTVNPLGDYVKPSATQQDFMGSGNWTGLGANTITDGQLLSGYTFIIGTDATGGENILVDGDSIAAEVRDGQTNSPSALLQGDADGNLAFLNRALAANSIPSIRIAIPSAKAKYPYTNQDDQFRHGFLAKLCDVAISEMGHNDATDGGSYSASPGFKEYMQAHWDRLRSSLRGRKAVVTTTLTPLTAQLLTDKWTTGRNSTYQSQSSTFLYPTGFVYQNYHPDLTGGTLVTATTGGVDGYIDLAAFASNLNGVAAIDGYWPVDGVTNYKYTTDGTHPSKDGHAGIASQITASVLRTAKAIP